VGGLENLKNWLKKSENLWLDSAQKYCLQSPNGLLITGVPGCGKSLIAKSISTMWQLPLLRLDVSRIFSGIIGSSEENMRKAIKVAEALSPSVLWVDEIEKGFGGVGSSGDSGTSSRVFGTFLTWMQEKTKPVFVVATANNIEHLPPEFLRAGRFDRIFFVDLPTEIERRDIFKKHLEKRLKYPEARGDFEVNEEILIDLSAKTEGFGGSEIEQIVIDGLTEAHYEKRSIQMEDLYKSIVNTTPLSITQEVQISKIRNWANDHNALSATSSEQIIGYEQKKKEKKKKPANKETFMTRGGRTIDF
jgi:SpoVK/Ycf46/Vps4 family AAA+-type ATPase